MLVANCHWYQRHRRQRHRCCWHRWQLMGTISGCRHLKVNLKAKIYIYVNSTTPTISGCKHIKVNLKAKIYIFVTLLPKGAQTTLLKFVCMSIFSICHPPVSTTPMVHLEPRISPRIFEKIRNGRNGIYSGASGKLIHEKNQKSKISWHCPIKPESTIKKNIKPLDISVILIYRYKAFLATVLWGVLWVLGELFKIFSNKFGAKKDKNID